jgi:hypothetical protein
MTVDGSINVSNVSSLPVMGIAPWNLSRPPKVNIGAIHENDPELIPEKSRGPDQGKKLPFGNAAEPF